MSDYTTADCVVILDKWLSKQMHIVGLGQWKRLKKSKNAQGLWSRLFENKVSSLVVEIVETPMGLVVIEPNVENNQVAQKSYMAYQHNQGTLYDDIGEKLKAGSPEKTIKYYWGVDNFDWMWNGQPDKDDNGIDVTCYSFVDNDSGRDYALLVYSDGSWVVFSD